MEGVDEAAPLSGADVVSAGVDDASAVEEASPTERLTTRTVRVASPTAPDWSMTRYVMVCSAGNDVSISGVAAARPSTRYVISRLRSACGAVIRAPRSEYVSPTFMVAGLFP